MSAGPLLAVSTSGPLWSLWLGDDPACGGELVSLEAPRGAPRDLVGALDRLLAMQGSRPAAQLPAKQLRGIAVDVGPGSFTSLRMGLAAVRALAWGAGLAVAPVSSLDALLSVRSPHEAPWAVAAIPARRGWWYLDARAPVGLSPSPPGTAAPMPRLVTDEELSTLTAAWQRAAAEHGSQLWQAAGPGQAAVPSARQIATLAITAGTWIGAMEVVAHYAAASEAETAAGLQLQEAPLPATAQPI